MPVSLNALPALFAGRALKADAVTAAQRTMQETSRLLQGYDLSVSILKGLPGAARDKAMRTLHARMAAGDRKAKAASDRLTEAEAFCRRAEAVASPTDPILVEDAVFEMLSPYIDDAMEPVLADLASRSGATPEAVASIFSKPRPALAL